MRWSPLTGRSTTCDWARTVSAGCLGSLKTMSPDVPAESTPDPVADALRLRASDADRERVASVLRDAYVEGRLSQVEHEERLAEVYRAATYGELVPVLRDLPVPPGTIAVPAPTGTGVVAASARSDAGVQVRPGQGGQADSNMVAIFGAFERKGAWTAPAELNATCVFGSGEVDFTGAVLTSMETVVTAAAIFGSLEITVPDGMTVRSEAIGILGSVEVPTDGVPTGAPVLVIKGAAIFGSIEVKRPKPPMRGLISRG